jgi:hypothetical protein
MERTFKHRKGNGSSFFEQILSERFEEYKKSDVDTSFVIEQYSYTQDDYDYIDLKQCDCDNDWGQLLAYQIMEDYRAKKARC